MKSKHVSRVIAAPAGVVYNYVAEPDNLSKWAAGLARSEIVRNGDRLVVDSPLGKVTVTFVPRNEYGIVDHDVRLPSGEVVNNPVRIITHPEGSEIIFTVRQLGLSEEQFSQDVAAVAADLDKLKSLLEGTREGPTP